MIGVAGAGMNALAGVLLARGYRVSGSDQQSSTQVERLIAQGLLFYRGHAPEQVVGAGLVIISAAVREENPELAAARATSIPVVKRAAALGWLLAPLRTIAVAGTHGKTTTSAMLAVILRHAGLDPTFVVGGEVLDLGASAAWGSGAWAVVEADEYDRSFLQLRPEIAIITNVEPDHLEYFGSVAAMREAYEQFVARIVPHGTLVLNVDDPYLRTVATATSMRVVACGHSSAGPRQWQLRHLHPLPEATGFTLTWAWEEDPGPRDLYIEMPLAGLHNAYNAMQAVAAARVAGVPPADAAEALRHFHGTGRRFQLVGEAAGVRVIDDYAHHPTEIRATLAAARARFAASRIIAIFQPHTFSRTKFLFNEFVTAFDDADLLVLTAIYAARESDSLGMDAAHLATALAARPGAPRVDLIPDLADIPSALAPQLRSGDTVLTLGAGTITEVGPRLLTALQGVEATL
jgi:UDP-N-acetylmuramate--alanine ligase